MNRVLNPKSVDLHIHTRFSDGNLSIEEASRAAQVKGLKIVAITDHYSELQELPRRMLKTQLRGYLESLRNAHTLKGLEAEVLGDGTVSISSETKKDFDIIIGGLHILHERSFWGDSRPILDPERFVEDVRIALLKAMESRLLDTIAHVTWLPESIRARMNDLMGIDWIRSVVEAASNFGVAIELSGAWKVPDERFVEECIHQGVRLSLGSDAHALNEIGETRYGIEILHRLRVPAELFFVPRNRIQ